MGNQYIPVPIPVGKQDDGDKAEASKKDTTDWGKTFLIGLVLSPIIMIVTLVGLFYFDQGMSFGVSINEAFETIRMLWS